MQHMSAASENPWINGIDALYCMFQKGSLDKKISLITFQNQICVMLTGWQPCFRITSFIMENDNTVARTHANVAQVQNTQTLNGRQEVQYFCQILFRLKFLQLFLPYCWICYCSCCPSRSFGSVISLLGLQLNYNGYACRMDVVKVWPFQISNIPPTSLKLYL